MGFRVLEAGGGGGPIKRMNECAPATCACWAEEEEEEEQVYVSVCVCVCVKRKKAKLRGPLRSKNLVP